MPKGKNPYFTTFAVGKQYNLTWTSNHHFHKGGIRLTLLDPNENIIQQLEPIQANDWAKETPLNLTLSFPRECHGCVLQLERQALEYGPNYIFHSCADVNIESALENSDEIQCSGNGRFTENGCICRKYFSGDRCQYRVECENDADCIHGKCIKESRPALIQKTCFCDYSFYGKNCETEFKNEKSEDMCFNYENLVDTSSPMFKGYGIFNPDCYNKIELNSEDFVYSRLIDNEVEVILDFNTTGWISIGWRPLKLDTSCRLFPDIGLPRSRSFRQTDSKQNGFIKSALQAPLHAMDCTDIIVASVIDGRSRIQDMYTRDRSTPLPDTFFEGENSLTAAFGIERDGRTVVMFRRNVREIEPSDHPLGPGPIHGIWAKSSETSDELRYHGGSRYRGTKVFEFVKHDAMPASGPLLFIRKNNPSTSLSSTTSFTDAPTPPPSEKPPQNTLDFSADFQVVDQIQAEPEPEPEPTAEPEPFPESTPFSNSITEASTFSPEITPELQSSSTPKNLIITVISLIISFIMLY
uniref:DOMON domain-containing protein n=1 Tax=Panagrolaimus superbus TaxID=310955 RepID=A0A914YMR3_9BILA